MFYEPGQDHGLPRDPFKACVVPRPISWISTISPDGAPNLAPYSFFNAVSSVPPILAYSSVGSKKGAPKDTLTNVEATGEFVVNVATEALFAQVVQTGADEAAEVDEIAAAGLTAAPSRIVKPPRIAESPISMECVLHQIVELPRPAPDERIALVLGRVVGVHIDESVLTDGRVDATKLRPLARLGYRDYAAVRDVFQP